MRVLLFLGVAAIACAKPVIETKNGDVTITLDSSSQNLYVAYADSNGAPEKVVLQSDLKAIQDQLDTLVQSVSNNTEMVNQLRDEVTSTSGKKVTSMADGFTELSTGAASQWQYMWNQNSQIGDSSGYVALKAMADNSKFTTDGTNNPTPTAGAAWLSVASGAIHPGQAAGQGTTTVSRYVILAYTIAQDGLYSITNSLMDIKDARGDGNSLRVYVNDRQVVWHEIDDKDGLELTDTFNVFLGSLSTGDVVYVAVGPRGVDYNDDMSLTFDIESGLLPGVLTKAEASSVYTKVEVDAKVDVKANSDDVIGHTVTKFTDGFAELKEGNPSQWKYMWNQNGAIGNADNYVELAVTPNKDAFTASGTAYPTGTANAVWLFVEEDHVHPGLAAEQSGANAVDRFVIMSYKVVDGGLYSITNSAMDLAGVWGDGNDVRVYVNNELRYDHQFEDAINGLTKDSFNVFLGTLQPNDVIYVAVGPRGTNHNDGIDFYFEVSVGLLPGVSNKAEASNSYNKFAIDTKINAKADNDALTALQADVTSGRKMSSMAAGFGELKEGNPSQWSFMWNKDGPLGNASNYVPLVVKGDKTGFTTDGNAVPTGPGNARYLFVEEDKVHPGQGGGIGGNTADRAAIVAYTVPQDGFYSITNSEYDVYTAAGDGNELRVLVNDQERLVHAVDELGADTADTFNMFFGLLKAGDVIYVAVGPKGTDANDDCGLKFDIEYGLGPALLPDVADGNRMPFFNGGYFATSVFVWWGKPAADTWVDVFDASAKILVDSGVYIFKISPNNKYQVGAGFWDEAVVSRPFIWYDGATNDDDADPVPIHMAGHASNNVELSFQTLRVRGNGPHKLQIKSSVAWSGWSYLEFTFLRIM